MNELITKAANAAILDGCVCDDTPNGHLAQWVRANVSYRPESEFFVVLLIAGEIADIQARREGFKSATDRAACKAFKKAGVMP